MFLHDIRRALSEEHYRSALPRRCTDTQPIQTWREFSAKADRDQVIEVGSLKKGAALADPLPSLSVIGHPTSTINMSNVIDRYDLGASCEGIACRSKS